MLNQLMVLGFMICPGKSWHILKSFFFSCFLIALVSQESVALPGYQMLIDSTKKNTLVISPRVNSTGHFPFSGSLLNYNINADLNIFYENRHLGFFVFKSFDLVDCHSYVNYLQPGAFATINLTDEFKVRGFFGYIFNQTTRFRDSDSDYYVATAFYLNVTPRIQLENTVLYYDYNINKKLANRFLLTWNHKKINVALYVWERIVFEEERYSTSASLAVTLPTLKLSERVSLKFTSSYWRYLTTSQPVYALRDGFLFTLAVPVELDH